MGPGVCLFVPTYNEVENLESLLRATAEQLDLVVPGNWRLLVVDDASPDGTGELAERLAREMPQLEVLHRRGKDGLGRAYSAGFDSALARGAELVIVMDADFSHDPRHLPALIAAARESDVVVGSRYVPGGRIMNWPLLRRVLSRGGSAYARRVLGVNVRDLTSGYRCVRRRVLEAVPPTALRSQGYVFNIELVYRALQAGFKVTEVPICFRDREAGESKLSLPIAIEALMLLPKLRRARPRPPERAAGTRLAGSRIVRSVWDRNGRPTRWRRRSEVSRGEGDGDVSEQWPPVRGAAAPGSADRPSS
jgi:dolichol-phosphate mannosyltransferase